MKITQLRFVLVVIDLVAKDRQQKATWQADDPSEYSRFIDYIIYRSIDFSIAFRAHTENTLGTAIVSAAAGFSSYAANIAIQIPIGMEKDLEEDLGPVFFFKSSDYELRLRAYYMPENKRMSDAADIDFAKAGLVLDSLVQVVSVSGMESGSRFGGDGSITVNFLEDTIFGKI